MKQIVFLSVVFVAMSIQLVHSAEAPALIERPGSGNGPTQVSVGIWIVDINNIDSAQQSFTADIAIVLRWKDARLAHTGTGAVHYALDQIWPPRVGVANETNSVIRKFPESAEVGARWNCFSIGSDTSVRLRSLYGYNRSRSIGSLFVFSSSRFDIALTKWCSWRMKTGSETDFRKPPAFRGRSRCPTGR